VEYLETTKAQYFRATLEDRRAFPLGLLGGGVLAVFRHALALSYVKQGLLAIDEAGVGIHHRRLGDYFRSMVLTRKSLGGQLALTTHSFEALAALVNAAAEHDPDHFAVVHLRRDEKDQVRATVIPGKDATSSLDHGYDLR
jgi:AAA15 family ATPase/GTPase